MLCISEIDPELLLRIKSMAKAKRIPIYRLAAQLLTDGLRVEALKQERQQAQRFAERCGLNVDDKIAMALYHRYLNMVKSNEEEHE